MPDPWTAAWEEAAATVPPSVVLYVTLALRHASFVDGVPFAVYVVADATEDVSLTLEGDAIIDAGATVTFKAVAFTAEMPEFAEGITPESKITIDNVARDLMPKIEAAVRVRSDLSVDYREYRSDDLSAPCYGPVTFVMKKVSANRTRITGTAKIDDLANKKFPNKFYTLKEFSGLQHG